jgi:hypothetical protein
MAAHQTRHLGVRQRFSNAVHESGVVGIRWRIYSLSGRLPGNLFRIVLVRPSAR